MFLKTEILIILFVLSKVYFSKSNDVGAVTFERLEFQIEKNSKYILITFKTIFFFNKVHSLIYIIDFKLQVDIVYVLGKVQEIGHITTLMSISVCRLQF